MPEVVIEIVTNSIGQPKVAGATITTTTSPLGKEDTPAQVIAAAKEVRDFITDFKGKSPSEE